MRLASMFFFKMAWVLLWALSPILAAGSPEAANSSAAQTREIQYQGMRFTVDVAGPEDGDVVILLHGHPQSRYTWRHEMKALAAAGYRGYAPDQRGYSPGARPEGIEAYSLTILVADVLALADAVGAQQFHLVGHDFGGGIAWITAARHPERVKSLAVISRPHPQAFREALRKDSDQQMRSGHHGRYQRPEATDEVFANNVARHRNMLRYAGVPEQDADVYLATFDSREAVDAALNWYRAAYRTAGDGQRPAVPVVVVPTLYVWGANDHSVGRYAAETTRDFVEAPYRFAELPGLGHFVTDEAPEVFPPLLLEHLHRHDRQGE